MVVWSIVALVSVKYVAIIMRADNRGEGGSLALLALITERAKNPRVSWIVTLLGIFAAALFFGDSMITPAISVLSAVEGMELITPTLKPYVIPITLMIITGLFSIQKRGTGTVGLFFGPVMVAWFGIIGVLGILEIIHNPNVLMALSPLYAFNFIQAHTSLAFLALGSVVLAVTGGEALYTDMGHFGCLPIRLAWFGFVMPALVLNYFGHGALLLAEPEAISNPFFHLGAGLGLGPYGCTGHGSHRDCLSGGDFRCLLGGTAINPDGTVATDADRSHLRPGGRTNLRTIYQLNALSGRRRTGYWL